MASWILEICPSTISVAARSCLAGLDCAVVMMPAAARAERIMMRKVISTTRTVRCRDVPTSIARKNKCRNNSLFDAKEIGRVSMQEAQPSRSHSTQRITRNTAAGVRYFWLHQWHNGLRQTMKLWCGWLIFRQSGAHVFSNASWDQDVTVVACRRFIQQRRGFLRP